MPCDLPFDVRTRGRAKFEGLRRFIRDVHDQVMWEADTGTDKEYRQAAADLQTELEDILERLG